VRQILLNLLTNAIKFTPRDGDVRAVTGYLDDGRVFLVVRDTGCGMNGKIPGASEALSSDDASQPLVRGNGIGLPLIRRLVREMGADIEIDSAPGKGTVVLIAFGGYARWSA
jgi:signal transduction histidine kinase